MIHFHTEAAPSLGETARTGRMGTQAATTNSENASALVRLTSHRVGSRFQEMLAAEGQTLGGRVARGFSRDRHGQGTPASGVAANPTPAAPGSGAPPAAVTPQRGNPSQSAPPAVGYLLPMQHVPYGMAVQPPSLPDPSGFDFELIVPRVPDSVVKGYMHPLEVEGSIGPRQAGSGPGGAVFASNVYRVPAWGLQDFVTSDGVRHRFDVEVVFPEAGATHWLGVPVREVHPEVADFVVKTLRDNMAAAGIPTSAVQSISVARAHGGPSARPWYMDMVNFVRADGTSFSGSMNIYLRDPKHTMNTLQEFFLGAIPS